MHQIKKQMRNIALLHICAPPETRTGMAAFVLTLSVVFIQMLPLLCATTVYVLLLGVQLQRIDTGSIHNNFKKEQICWVTAAETQWNSSRQTVSEYDLLADTAK